MLFSLMAGQAMAGVLSVWASGQLSEQLGFAFERRQRGVESCELGGIEAADEAAH